MMDWTSGYVAEIDYTYGYYPELNPIRVGLAFANVGVVAPRFKTACELGFGQGVSVNIHAAATQASWYGTDFNPAQASFGVGLNISTLKFDLSSSYHNVLGFSPQVGLSYVFGKSSTEKAPEAL